MIDWRHPAGRERREDLDALEVEVVLASLSDTIRWMMFEPHRGLLATPARVERITDSVTRLVYAHGLEPAGPVTIGGHPLLSMHVAWPKHPTGRHVVYRISSWA